MKNKIVEFKDIYDTAYYSQQEIDIEKIFTQLYGMLEPINYEGITSTDIFLLQLQTIELLSSMEKDSHKHALANLKTLKSNTIHDNDALSLIKALELQANFKYKEAHFIYRNILHNNPRNRLSFFALHMLEFNLGWQKHMLETSRIVVNSLKDSTDSYYGYAKGIESFSLVENGLYEEAKDAANIALQINAKDIYAIHAMCHYFYETGKYNEGIIWMEKIKENWIFNKGMRIHVWWHLAVFHLFNLNLEEVKNIMINEIMCKNYEDGLEDLDATALLWRLYLLGEKNIEFYETLDNWDDYLKNSHFIFNDLHALMAYTLKNDTEKIELCIEYVKTREHNLIKDDHLNLLYGFYYFAKQNYKDASERLKAILNKTNFGGSNAQRDVISLTLFISLLKSNRNKEAKILLETDRAFKNSSKMKEKLMNKLGDVHY